MSTKTTDAAREALVAALGVDKVRPADETDEISGVRPQWVAAVEDTQRVAAAMRVAAEHELCVVPKGSGSKLDWGAPPRSVDLVLDLSSANRIVEHAAGDLVVHALAGTPIDEINKAVRESGQQLAIDQAFPTATTGGVIATASSGPGRHLFGGVRDLLIGITVVLADGTVTTAGGKVVKNVAGYDLGKMYTGSFGTLGIITEAVFRLHPVAAEHRWVSVVVDSSSEAAAIANAIRSSQAMPTAIEVHRPETRGALTVCAQLEGRPSVTDERARVLAASISDQAEVRETSPSWWADPTFEPGGTGIRVASEPAEAGELLGSISDVAGGLPLSVRGAIGLGVLHVGIPATAEPAQIVDFVRAMRERAGYAVVERAPRAVLDVVDPWGPIAPGVLTLMRRSKDQFDPQHRLAPGRFVGGI